MKLTTSRLLVGWTISAGPKKDRMILAHLDQRSRGALDQAMRNYSVTVRISSIATPSE